MNRPIYLSFIIAKQTSLEDRHFLHIFLTRNEATMLINETPSEPVESIFGARAASLEGCLAFVPTMQATLCRCESEEKQKDPEELHLNLVGRSTGGIAGNKSFCWK